MRPNAPSYTRISADDPLKDQGHLYLYDVLGRRIVSVAKSNGAYVHEYVLPDGSPYFSGLEGMFIRTGPNSSNPTLFWIESGNLLWAPLYTPSPATPSPSAGPSGSGKAKVTPKPTAKPKPAPTY